MTGTPLRDGKDQEVEPRKLRKVIKAVWFVKMSSHNVCMENRGCIKTWTPSKVNLER